MSGIKINLKGTSDNITNLKGGWNPIMTKIRLNKIIIKPADKGLAAVFYDTQILLDNLPIAFT